MQDSLLDPSIQRLVAELRSKLSLSEIDSRRAAFVVVAFNKGWRKAKVGRYLAVSRARIGQRILRYRQYAESGEWPELSGWMANPKIKAGIESSNLQVSFKREDWEDLELADALLNRLLQP